MLYQVSLTIPANTPETEPVSERLTLTLGVSTRREVEFPDGCCGLVGAAVHHLGVQIVPWSHGIWVQSSGNVVVDDSPYPLTTPPYFFTLFAYNEDTVNEHTITLRIIMREGEVEEYLNLEQFLNALRGY